MDEIYLKIDSTTSRVTLIHYSPFDINNGLIKADETISDARTRLSVDGVFVTDIPEPQYSTAEYRAVLKYSTLNAGYNSAEPNTGCFYEYLAVPSGDTILLNTLENAIAEIKTIIPTSKLLIVYEDTEDKSNFDISELFSSNPNYGISVNKNGLFLKNNIDFSLTKSEGVFTLKIFSGLEVNDYAIVIAYDNLSEHTHSLVTISGLTQELNNKSSIGHTHSISEIANMSSTLLNLAPLVHQHELTDLKNSGATEAKNGLVKISDNYNLTSSTTAASSSALKLGLATKSSTYHTHNYLPIAGGSLTGQIAFRTSENVGNGVPGGEMYLGDIAPTAMTRLNYNGYLYATKIYNAAYGDLAECFEPSAECLYEDVIEHIVEIDNNEKIRIATECSKTVIGIISSNFGFALNGSHTDILDGTKIPVGLAGTLWVKSEDSANIKNIGKFICAGKNGLARVIPDGGTLTIEYEGSIVGKIIAADPKENKYRVLLKI